MHVALLRGENLRLYKKLEMSPHARLNVILGANASGKTTFIESLYCLSRGRSFRGHSLAELAGPGKDRWWIHAKLQFPDNSLSLGLGWSRKETRIRIAETSASIADIARTLPVQMIEPGQHRMLEEGPAYRRSYLDWGVFHVEPSFLNYWRRYQRALKQRNKALRLQRGIVEVKVWNRDLAEAGEQVTQLREKHLEALRPALSRVSDHLFHDADALSWEYLRGWTAKRSLLALLNEDVQRHLDLGTTSDGPHRAELRIRLNARSLKGQASRGQQKLAIAAMVLAQCETIQAHTGGAPIAMVDDFAAELSPEFQFRLASALNDYAGQVFVTAFEEPVALNGVDRALFHVEQGEIRQAA